MNFLILLDKLLPMLFWITVMLGFDMTYVAVLTVISAVIHELGHFAVFYILKKTEKANIFGKLSGFRIKTGALSYKEELLVAAGGPAINLIMFLISFIPCSIPGFSYYLHTFGAVNLMTALSNMLPIENYDGYKILLSSVSIFSPNCIQWENALQTVSFSFCILICFLSLYVMLKIGEGYWIFAVFFSIMISGIIKRQKRTIYEN